MKVDLSDPRQCKQLAAEHLDSIICLNVLEHIEHDEATLRNFLDMLEPGGHAIILVPAHTWLYTPCDKTLGHFRRYTPDELRTKLLAAGFDVASLQQFNRLGVYGWWVSGKLKRESLTPFQMRLYEVLLPLAMLMDRMKLGPGLSVIGVGRKPHAQPAQMQAGSVTEQSVPT
jgi:SAM-dependent methyltransferase